MPTIMPPPLNLSAAAAELPVVRVSGFLRRACVLAAAVAAGLFCVAAPATADVTVSPATATQGEGINLTFRVVNDHPKAALTKVRLVMPTATPIAEVYPLSVPEWGPRIATRTLDTPLETIHGGSPVTEATASITWFAAPGKALKPGKATDLSIAIGPMPEVDRMSFEIQASYADGSAGPAIAPVALALTAPVIAPVEESSSSWIGSGWIVLLLISVGAAVLALLWSRRSRRSEDTGGAGDTAADERTAPDGDAEADDPAATAHKARVTAWSYRDAP
jgi:hypothetical protein